jgi:hypothetical protein
MQEQKGLTRQQILDYLKHKAEVMQQSSRPLVATELYDSSNLSLVTENPPHMVVAKVRLRLVLEAQNPKRGPAEDLSTWLLSKFIQFYNEEMVSFKRQGRQEYLGALQALVESSGGGGEPTVSMR